MRLEEVRRDFRPIWKVVLHEQREETQSFREREKTLLGQAENTLRSMNPKSIMQSEDRRAALKTAFKALASAGARLEALKLEQEETRRQLTAQQKQIEQQAIAALKADQQQKVQEARRRFQIEREELIFTQLDGKRPLYALRGTSGAQIVVPSGASIARIGCSKRKKSRRTPRTTRDVCPMSLHGAPIPRQPRVAPPATMSANAGAESS